ncbi:unnamed protein product, partial [Boreogadus saida]
DRLNLRKVPLEVLSIFQEWLIVCLLFSAYFFAIPIFLSLGDSNTASTSMVTVEYDAVAYHALPKGLINSRHRFKYVLVLFLAVSVFFFLLRDIVTLEISRLKRDGETQCQRNRRRERGD